LPHEQRFKLLWDTILSRASELVGEAIEACSAFGVTQNDAVERAAAAAFEFAFWDVSMRRQGRLFMLALPGSRVPVNALISAADADLAAQEAARAREAGFKTVKLKVGMSATVGEESARVEAVREALGPDIKLRLDANGAWNLGRAVGTIDAVAQFDL